MNTPLPLKVKRPVGRPRIHPIRIGPKRAYGQGPTMSKYIPGIPRTVWHTFKRRQKADSAKLGRYIRQEEIILDLIRQYADAVTYFGKRHVAAPPPIFPAFSRSR